MSVWAIVPAAGIGSRMGGDVDLPKQYRPLLGKPVIEWSLQALLSLPEVSAVVVVLHPHDQYWQKLSIASNDRVLSAKGGDERQHSVLAGLSALTEAGAEDWVLVHDAARPCVRSTEVRALLAAVAADAVGGLLAAPTDNTLKQVDAQRRLVTTVDRRQFWQALTPQVFRYGLLSEALGSAIDAGVAVTDESAAIERLGHKPLLVPGDKQNIKITHASDLDLAEFYLSRGAAQER